MLKKRATKIKGFTVHVHVCVNDATEHRVWTVISHAILPISTVNTKPFFSPSERHGNTSNHPICMNTQCTWVVGGTGYAGPTECLPPARLCC